MPSTTRPKFITPAKGWKDLTTRSKEGRKIFLQIYNKPKTTRAATLERLVLEDAEREGVAPKNFRKYIVSRFNEYVQLNNEIVEAEKNQRNKARADKYNAKRRENRSNFKLIETAFDRYSAYNLSVNEANWLFRENYTNYRAISKSRITNLDMGLGKDEELVNYISKAQLKKYTDQVLRKMKPTITKKLKQNGMSRVFFNFEVESYNTSGGAFFTRKKTSRVPEYDAHTGKQLKKLPISGFVQLDSDNTIIEERRDEKYTINSDKPVISAMFLDIRSFEEFRAFFEKTLLAAVEKEDDYVIPFSLGNQRINILKYNPLSGGSYAALPDSVRNSKSVINIKNTDNKCFLYSCVASRYPADRDGERVSKYIPFMNDFKFHEADFPMKLDGIPRFERENNVRINVYTWDSGAKIPLLLSRSKSEEIINLFYYDDHYSLIKNFQRFVGGDHKFVCERCLKCYRNKESFETHSSICSELNENGSLIGVPKERSKTKFSAYKNQKMLPIVMYSDFETSPEERTSITKDGAEIEKSYVTAEHKANSYRIRIESKLDLPFPVEYAYCGSDAALHFINQIMELDKQINEFLQMLNEQNKVPCLTEDEEHQFQSATKCYLCNYGFNESKQDKNGKFPFGKCRDHDHFTAKYCGAAHNVCNLKAEQMRKGRIEVPVFFHNANYDIRCFINAFADYTGGDLSNLGGIPCNMEFFKTLNLNNLVIKDSYAHLSSSLDILIKNLSPEYKTLLNTIGTTEKQKALVQKKGFYPYEYITSHERINMPISDLKREHFNNKLTLSELSDEDWEHVQNVIREFGITTFREYHDLYLKIDVYGLTDVMETYRNLSYNKYGLDPAHYIGLPGFTWDAGLKFTGKKLENMTDMEMILMTEKLKRGGVSVISGRYAKANNPYLPDYNPEQKTTYLTQLDCNNLYGGAMCEKLPVGDFKWCDDFDLENYDPQGDEGAILDVDLEYPEELHDTHNDYPLAPEHLLINGGGKLAPNLLDKKNYIVYVDNLQYYISKGMRLTKIHRCFTFKREAWLKPYIDKNSLLRQAAKNEFEKDFYKLMNNAFYGKTMENERDRVNIQFCQSAKQFEKYTCSPLFAGQILVIKSGINSLSMVKTHKKNVQLTKPIYTGAVILEISKLIMYKFHYDTMLAVYPNAKMLKTDTDSLLYEIETEDIYRDFGSNALLRKKLEFSNYPEDHPLYNTDHKKVPCWFQEECIDGTFVIIEEYGGLRAKSYALKLYTPINESFIGLAKLENSCYADKKKSKGVPKVHIKKRITFEDYRDCLTTGKSKSLDKLVNFRSFGLRTYTVSQTKVALSAADDKRIIREDGIRTYAYGHKDSKTENKIQQRGNVVRGKTDKEKMDEIFPPEEDWMYE